MVIRLNENKPGTEKQKQMIPFICRTQKSLSHSSWEYNSGYENLVNTGKDKNGQTLAEGSKLDQKEEIISGVLLTNTIGNYSNYW